MARGVGDIVTTSARSVVLSRPLEELASTSEWERVLVNDDPVELEVSVVEIVRVVRESGEA